MEAKEHKNLIINVLTKLNLPKGQYAVFGGSSLAVRNIRATNDIDIYVTKELYEELKSSGWDEIKKEGWFPYLKSKVNGTEVEVFIDSKIEGWQPDVKGYIKNPEIIDGFPFMPLKELYKWKSAVRRPKDLIDLELIKKYWQEQRR